MVQELRAREEKRKKEEHKKKKRGQSAEDEDDDDDDDGGEVDVSAGAADAQPPRPLPDLVAAAIRLAKRRTLRRSTPGLRPSLPRAVLPQKSLFTPVNDSVGEAARASRKMAQGAVLDLYHLCHCAAEIKDRVRAHRYPLKPSPQAVGAAAAQLRLFQPSFSVPFAAYSVSVAVQAPPPTALFRSALLCSLLRRL